MSIKRIHQGHNSISRASCTSAPTEAGFNQSDEVIAAFFNSATVGFALVDTQLRFVALNEALAQMNGVPLKHHLGKQIRQVLGEAAQKIEPVFRQVLTTARATHNVQITALLPTRNQVGRWIESYFPVSDKNGMLTHIGATVVEVASPSAVSDLSPTCEAAAASEKPGVRSGFPLFGGSTPAIADLMSRTSKLQQRSRGEFFCRQGEPSSTLFLLKRGRVKLCGTTHSGKEVLLDWMLPGEVFGFGTLLTHPGQNLWSVVAVDDSEALAWDKAEVMRLAKLSPQIFENALQVSVQWCARLQQRFEQLSDGFVEQRLAHLALYLADRFKHNGFNEIAVSDAEMAEMAGTNLYSVNKVLNRWQRQGYVAKRRRHLLILDRKSLKQLSIATVHHRAD